jgi:hypothetical protein
MTTVTLYAMTTCLKTLDSATDCAAHNYEDMLILASHPPARQAKPSESSNLPLEQF